MEKEVDPRLDIAFVEGRVVVDILSRSGCWRRCRVGESYVLWHDQLRLARSGQTEVLPRRPGAAFHVGVAGGYAARQRRGW